MEGLNDSEVLPIVVMNVVLGLGCLAAVLAVTGAALLDIREKRRWRAMVPDCWPPPGVDPEAAYVEQALPATAPASTTTDHEEDV